MFRTVLKETGRVFVAATLVLIGSTAVDAQTTVALPDSSQTTLLTATVSEQARIVVPASVSFGVNNIANATASSAATVTVDRIVLSSATKQLRVSVQAAAASFTPPAVGAITWSASDVTWNECIFYTLKLATIF